MFKRAYAHDSPWHTRTMSYMINEDLFQIDKWYKYKEILSSVTLAVVPRGDDDMDAILERKAELEAGENARICISKYRGRNISSTAIREDPEGNKDLLPAGTYEYIREHGLYINGR